MKRRDGTSFVCETPEPAVKLEVKRGKVVATLESGMKFIVPVVVREDEDTHTGEGY